MQGLPFGLVCMVSPILYKTVGLNNAQIAFYTSVFTLPWIFKFFLAPALETIATKRTFTWLMQIFIACFVFLLACNFFQTNWYVYSLLLFCMIAMAAAIHDIHVDGLYLECLSSESQAKFIGIRSLCYQIGKLLIQGVFIFLIGVFIVIFEKETAWQLAFFILSIGIFILAMYHRKNLPVYSNKILAFNWQAICYSYKQVLTELSQLPNLLSNLGFIFIYNFAEAQLMKIFPLFLLDKKTLGGLELSVSAVGIISSVSLVGILLGMVVSGFLLSRFTLKKCFIPFTLLAALGNMSYLIISYYSMHSVAQIIFCILIAQFCFGLSNSAYMLYLVNLFSASKKYSMSLYAIGTAIMLAGMMVAGSISGYLQVWLGYNGFFLWIILVGLSVVGVTNFMVKHVNQ